MSAEGITDSGFQFLLMSVSSQLWIVIREYVKGLEKNSAANTDQGSDHPLATALGFIFQLSFSVPYRAYPLSELSEAKQRVVKSLSMLGLTLLVGKQREWYIPSKLARMLSAGISSTKRFFFCVNLVMCVSVAWPTKVFLQLSRSAIRSFFILIFSSSPPPPPPPSLSLSLSFSFSLSPCPCCGGAVMMIFVMVLSLWRPTFVCTRTRRATFKCPFFSSSPKSSISFPTSTWERLRVTRSVWLWRAD